MDTSVKFYLVGGAVRDGLMGIPSKDKDYSVEAPSYAAMKKAIEERGGQIFLETIEHFTIRAKIPVLGAADFVLCRKDGFYSDGRRPDSVEMGTLWDDLARRDFTMNAIAQAEDGTIIDPFEGRKAIAGKIISCVGSAKARLWEDALRMLRAIRFSITKGFLIDAEIEECLHPQKFLDRLATVSIERIREELLKCFETDTRKTLHLLCHVYHGLGNRIFDNNRLWLKPSIREA